MCSEKRLLGELFSASTKHCHTGVGKEDNPPPPPLPPFMSSGRNCKEETGGQKVENEMRRNFLFFSLANYRKNKRRNIKGAVMLSVEGMTVLVFF